MGKGMEEEKYFSEQIDRILDGYEIHPQERDNDDLRTALEFARKMTDLRISPSSVFEARLRERLIEKLEAQETRKQGWFSKLILQQPIWQAAAGVVLVLIFASILYLTGVFEPRQPIVSVPTTTPVVTAPAATTTAPTTTVPATTSAPTMTTTRPPASTTTTPPPAISVPKVFVSATTNKASYSPGEPVIIDVTLQNGGSELLTIEKYPPILSLMHTETKQPVYTFAAGSGIANLPPNARTSYTIIWHQQDTKGGTVSPGSYFLELEDLDYHGQAIKLNLSNPVKFDIVG